MARRGAHTARPGLQETLRLDPSHLGMDPLDWVVDAVFYLDLVLNFWTGYLSGHMIVTDKTRIAKHCPGRPGASKRP